MFGFPIASSKEGGIKSPPLIQWRVFWLLLKIVWVILMIPYRIRKLKVYSPLDINWRMEFVLDQFKSLALEMAVLLDKVIPDPAEIIYRRNPNSQAVIELRDRYLKQEILGWGRDIFAKVVFNLTALLIEYNTCYDKRASWLRKEWAETDWRTILPDTNWRSEIDEHIDTRTPVG